MSLAAACGWTLLRSLAIATLSVPLCVLLARFVAHHNRRWPVVCLAIVFLMPELLVGYAWSNTALAFGSVFGAGNAFSLIQYPVLNELLAAVIVGLKMVPIGTAAVLLAPRSPLNPEAIHLRQMSMVANTNAIRRLVDRVRYWLLGPGRELVPAFGLLFLLAFQEFEIASLMRTTSWTVWMFDAHARGQFLSETLRLVLVPTLCEAIVIVPLLVFAIRSRRAANSQQRELVRLSKFGRRVSSGLIVCCLLFVCVIPVALESKNFVNGLPVVLRSRSHLWGLTREVGAGCAFGVLAAMLAFFVSNRLRAALRTREGRENSGLNTFNKFERLKAGFLIGLGLPGLWGSFVLGIIALAAFQTDVLNGMYDTPIPLVLTLAVFLFPRVVLLSVLLFSGRKPEAERLSELLSASSDNSQREQSRHLSWMLSGRMEFLAIAIPAWWGYFNLTLAAMLGPVGMVTAPVNLYNLMHYGRTAALSAIALLAVVVPLVLGLVAFLITRKLTRITRHKQTS